MDCDRLGLDRYWIGNRLEAGQHCIGIGLTLNWLQIGMDWYHIGNGLALVCCWIGTDWCWIDIGLALDGNELSSEWNGLTLHWKRIDTRLLLDWR